MRKEDWIKVEDRLPEEGERVLILFWNGHIHTGHLQKSGTWAANFNDYKVELSTHWMQITLPEE